MKRVMLITKKIQYGPKFLFLDNEHFDFIITKRDDPIF